MAGKRTPHSEGNPLINNQRLQQLYASMLRCRLLGERCRARGLKKNGSVSVGHEATVAGILSHLRADDLLAPASGDLVTGFLKGASLESLFAQLAATSEAPSQEKTRDDLIPPAADALSTLTLATGAALACKLQQSDRMVTVFFGAEAGAMKGWKPTLEFAATHRLPAIYVVQMEEPRKAKKRGAKPAVELAGLPVIPVDGQDVVAVYRVAQESIQRARQGSGPTLIRSIAYLGAKAGSRRAGAVAEPADPLRRMEAYLVRKGLFNETWKRHIGDKFLRELDTAEQALKPIKRSARKRS